MALIKNDIPILEYDTNPTAIIMPRHEALPYRFPRKAVYAFLGEHIDEYAYAHDAKIIGRFVSATKLYPVYLISYKGQEICLCQAPVGAAAAAQLMDWLIGYGVDTIISAGSCGALVDLPENTFLVPTRALRDEGTSYHYLPASRFVKLNEEVRQSMEQTLTDMGLPYTECTTWSTDGFYRETREKIEYRKSEGCSVVEMECSALAACAQFRGIRFGQLLFTADSLANLDAYDERSWGAESFAKALHLCLDLVAELR